MLTSFGRPGAGYARHRLPFVQRPAFETMAQETHNRAVKLLAFEYAAEGKVPRYLLVRWISNRFCVTSSAAVRLLDHVLASSKRLGCDGYNIYLKGEQNEA